MGHASIVDLRGRQENIDDVMLPSLECHVSLFKRFVMIICKRSLYTVGLYSLGKSTAIFNHAKQRMVKMATHKHTHHIKYV